MTFVGLAVTFLGFVIAFASLGLIESTGGRMGMVLLGIVVSLVGIMGVMTPAYQKTWIFKNENRASDRKFSTSNNVRRP